MVPGSAPRGVASTKIAASHSSRSAEVRSTPRIPKSTGRTPSGRRLCESRRRTSTPNPSSPRKRLPIPATRRAISADPRELLAGQHRQDALAPDERAHGDESGVLRYYSTHHCRVAPLRMRAQRREDARLVILRDRRHEAALAGDVQGVEAQHLARAADFVLEGDAGFVELDSNPRGLRELVQGAR